MNKTVRAFAPADILLPDFSRVDGSKWACIACDQFTSEPDYWTGASDFVGSSPSTLSMILPEVYLSEAEARIPSINASMVKSLSSDLVSYPNAVILVEREQSDGKIRRGLVLAVDLECYDYRAGSETLIRATEGTVLERIPPRVAIRRDAPLEFPHVMLLIDDPEKTVIEPIASALPASGASPLYDFDLMQGGGHIRGYLLPEAMQASALSALDALAAPAAMKEKYHADLAPLLFAVGDGNHSLATAKACYEEVKARIGAEAAASHPSRYALAEVVNLHDSALGFEPIYRVVFGVEPTGLLRDFRAYCSSLSGSAAPQTVRAVWLGGEEDTVISAPVQQLAVGTLQTFLFDYQKAHPSCVVDYIHGEDSLRSLAAQKGAIGFLFAGMKKEELFPTVLFDGALPRKTFSMGHARDKRYYLEGRKIK